jgi:hypothetical protein
VSFLIDPALLYASGRAYAHSAPAPRDKAHEALAVTSTMAIFWGVSVSLYLNKRWTVPIWRACRAASGRDWMLNSGVLGLDPERAGPVTHVVSAAIFASYPMWLWLGMRDGRRQALLTHPDPPGTRW